MLIHVGEAPLSEAVLRYGTVHMVEDIRLSVREEREIKTSKALIAGRRTIEGAPPIFKPCAVDCTASS